MGKPPLLAKLIWYHIYPGKNAAGGGGGVAVYEVAERGWGWCGLAWGRGGTLLTGLGGCHS